MCRIRTPRCCRHTTCPRSATALRPCWRSSRCSRWRASWRRATTTSRASRSTTDWCSPRSAPITLSKWLGKLFLLVERVLGSHLFYGWKHQRYSVCHGFRFTTQDDYFWVNFDHFWIQRHFIRQLGQYWKSAQAYEIRTATKLSLPKSVKLTVSGIKTQPWFQHAFGGSLFTAFEVINGWSS